MSHAQFIDLQLFQVFRLGHYGIELWDNICKLSGDTPLIRQPDFVQILMVLKFGSYDRHTGGPKSFRLIEKMECTLSELRALIVSCSVRRAGAKPGQSPPLPQKCAAYVSKSCSECHSFSWFSTTILGTRKRFCAKVIEHQARGKLGAGRKRV